MRMRAFDKGLASVAIVLTAWLAARSLYFSAYDASDLRISPDEIEYAVCAQRLATLGKYDLVLDGVSTPPRSTPWFSSVLAPAYLVPPHEPGNGVWIVFAFALAGVIVAMRIGCLVAGPIGGALASIGLLATPVYVRSAHLIMTDCPSVVLGLVAVWLFVRWSTRDVRVRESLIAGLLVMVATSFRSANVAMLLPFIWRAARAKDRRVAQFAALLAPLAALAAADGIYNHAAFGSWSRTGYQFWVAVPADYPDLVLSLSYLKLNLATLARPDALRLLSFGAIGIVLLALRRPPRWTSLLGAAAATSLPIVAFHLVYFYQALRLQEYLLSLCMVLGGIGVACSLPASWRVHRLSAIASIVLIAIAFAVIPTPPRVEPSRRETVEAVLRATPDDAVIVSGLEPVYVAAFAPPSSRRTFLAASREVEFASKVLVRTRVPRELAAPRNALDHAAPGLLAHGGRWAIAHTADEMHEEIDAWVRAGRAVFLETRFLPNPAATERMLGSSLRVERFDPGLMRVLTKD
jgi:hypothetical protein